MNPRAIAIIAVGCALWAAWQGFCLYNLARADRARVRYLPKWGWAVICLASCPWGGLAYLIFGRPALGRDVSSPG